jgi:hypothetical protein
MIAAEARCNPLGLPYGLPPPPPLKEDRFFPFPDEADELPKPLFLGEGEGRSRRGKGREKLIGQGFLPAWAAEDREAGEGMLGDGR